jgi:predicted DNA-binding transcriptional regulator AlpA
LTSPLLKVMIQYMPIQKFRRWLRRKIQELDLDLDASVCEGAAAIVQDAGAKSLGLGLPDLYRKCRFNSRLDDGTPILSPGVAREILSECLAGLPAETTATITIKQLSDLTGWSRATIYRYRKEGRIPAPFNEGKQVYWLRSELRSIL